MRKISTPMFPTKLQANSTVFKSYLRDHEGNKMEYLQLLNPGKY